MFHIGDIVGIYPNSDADTVPVGQGVLAATRPQYEVRDLRWRLSTRTRSRLWFDAVSCVERYEGHYFMLRPEYHTQDATLLAKLFPASCEGDIHGRRA
jgi:hypothetical protein